MKYTQAWAKLVAELESQVVEVLPWNFYGISRNSQFRYQEGSRAKLFPGPA
jgi:hypothetical protein